MSFSGSYSFSFGAGKGLQREISKSTRRCTAKDIYKLEWILKSAQKTRKVWGQKYYVLQKTNCNTLKNAKKEQTEGTRTK